MKRFKYNMHHQWISAPRIGELRPCFLQEVTPGETWSGKSTAVFRLAPMDVPTYMSLKVCVHFFFVPHRLVWDEFEDVITGADTSTAWPTITYNSVGATDLMEFGIGNSPTLNPEINALPIRAYNLVYNEHFRNHLIETERSLDAVGVARVRFPSNDYYGGITTELQQGSEETIDTSGATLGVTAIKEAFNRQRFRERRSQYGERYRDYLAADFGVRTPDSRLDRPEHCARGRTTIGISEVVATATSTSENTGEYRGHGIAGMNIRFPKRRFLEHGTLVGVMYARPRLQLKTQHDRMWLSTDKEDLYQPSLADDRQVNVGIREIYAATGTDTVFGYQARDEWLRSARDVIAGKMKYAAQEPWTAHIPLSSAPTVSFLQQVQDYDHLFQDQTSNRNDLHSFFDHKIAKLSPIKPRRK